MEKRPRRWLIALPLLAAAVVIAGVVIFLHNFGWEDTSLFEEKADLLAEQALADWVLEELGSAPAGQAGHAAFLSVSDGQSAAEVFHAAGGTPHAAYNAAVQLAKASLRRSGLDPAWVKADLVYISYPVDQAQLAQSIAAAGPYSFHYGLSPTPDFAAPLLEAQLNAHSVYSAGQLDLSALNACLQEAGGKPLSSLPDEVTIFQCASWFCDENKQVCQLSAAGHDYGRRQLDAVNAEYALALTLDAASSLASYAQPEGGFRTGYDPLHDQDLPDPDPVGELSALRALIRSCNLTGDESAEEKIVKSLDQALESVQKGEPDLSLLSLTLLALTDHCYAFGPDAYLEDCKALGDQLTARLHSEKNTYLPEALSDQNGSAIIYEDAQALSALCALCGLTSQQKYLDAVQEIAGFLLAQGLEQPSLPVVAAALNDLTKLIPSDPNYYAFALEYAKRSLENQGMGLTLPFLMSAFETYARMLDNGGQADGFQVEELLGAISYQAQLGLDNYFYPEYAMYMPKPQKAAGAFMDRAAGMQVNVFSAADALTGYYAYFANYSRMEGLAGS